MTLVIKNLPASAGDMKDMGSIPASGRSPAEGHGNPLGILARKIPRTDEPGGQATVHGVTESWTELKRLSVHARTLK